MSDPTTPISEKSLQLLQELSQETGMTLIEMLDLAVDDYRCRVFLERVENVGPVYVGLWIDPEVWPDELLERNRWEEPLVTRLGPDDYWTENGRHVVRDEELT